MEKFHELNIAILNDDGTANLDAMIKSILKEILREKEEKEAGLNKDMAANGHGGFGSVEGNSNNIKPYISRESGVIV
jgi:hypothetical protein